MRDMVAPSHSRTSFPKLHSQLWEYTFIHSRHGMSLSGHMGTSTLWPSRDSSNLVFPVIVSSLQLDPLRWYSFVIGCTNFGYSFPLICMVLAMSWRRSHEITVDWAPETTTAWTEHPSIPTSKKRTGPTASAGLATTLSTLVLTSPSSACWHIHVNRQSFQEGIWDSVSLSGFVLLLIRSMPLLCFASSLLTLYCCSCLFRVQVCARLLFFAPPHHFGSFFKLLHPLVHFSFIGVDNSTKPA